MITNKGIYFPEAGDLDNALGADDNARMTTVFTEITQGRAGNPVFTDSMRCEGGED